MRLLLVEDDRMIGSSLRTAMRLEGHAVDWVRDAFGHCKVLGFSADAQPLLDKAGVQPDAGVVNLESAKAVGSYITTAKEGRIWAREPSMRRPG